MNAPETPQKWAAIPLQYVCKLNPQVDLSEFQDGDELTFLPMNRVKSGYFIPNSENFSKHALSYNTFAEGDIVLAKVTPCFENGNIAIAENLVNGKGFGSSELFVVRATNADRKFLFYCLQSSTFKQEGEASMTGAGGLKRVSPDVIRKHRIYFPSSNVQRLIANYLDLEIVRIDALVAEKEHMLALLEEKGTALISRAVTLGLNPDAPLKPSGLDWLGNIPVHWGLERAKTLFSVRDQRSEKGEEELLTVSHITGVTRRSEKDVNMFQADDKAGYKLCYPGDLVINTLWGWMGAMGVSPLKGIVSPDYHVYTTKKLYLPEFVEFLCRSKPFVAEVNRWSKGVWSSRLRLYPENFFEIRLPVPSEDEQREIVIAIVANQNKTKELVRALQQSLALAKERRTALITAAVTGQIPVKEMIA
jgi:type I restriction enzyme S subunit